MTVNQSMRCNVKKSNTAIDSSAAMFDAYKLTLSADAAMGKARDSYRHAARVLWDSAGEEMREAIQDDPQVSKDYLREAVLSAFQGHAKQIKNAVAWKNTTAAVRGLFLLYAFPDEPIKLSKVETDAEGVKTTTVETLTPTAVIGNAAKEQDAIGQVRLAKGLANARKPKTPTVATGASDPIKAGQKVFEEDMVAARATLEAILKMKSGWGMVIDVLRLHGFNLVKIEKAAA